MSGSELSKSDMQEALEWARSQVKPPLSVSAMARTLGVARTTYASWENGAGKVTEEILDRVGKVRGLNETWYKNWESPLRVVDKSLLMQNEFRSVVITPSVLVPNFGYLTQADLRSDLMQKSSKPLQVPSHLALPGMVGAAAEADDTMPAFSEGVSLFFLPIDIIEEKPKLGSFVAARLPNGKLSLRQLVWNGESVICRSIRDVYASAAGRAPKDDIDRVLCSVDALLVGWISENTEISFQGSFHLKGQLQLPNLHSI